MSENQQSEITDQKSLILLCPGQGAQAVGMGKAWVDVSPAAKQVFDEANDVLGLDLARICFDGPADELNRTDIAQAAIYTASVASFRGLVERGELAAEHVVATAGLSLGEFTALHLAGTFTFAQGLRLVRLRGQAMQDAADSNPGSMVALIGADEAQADQLCDLARGDDVLNPANFNAPGQIVISGSKSACDRAVERAGDVGVSAKALVVAGAFHSPLMQPAADRLAEALASVQWRTPSVPVCSNVTGEAHSPDPASISARLVEQLTHPVRWAQNMSWMLAQVSGELHEMAPGRVLSGLMRRIDRAAKVTAHDAP